MLKSNYISSRHNFITYNSFEDGGIHMNKCIRCQKRIGIFRYKNKSHCYQCFIDEVEQKHEITQEQIKKFEEIKRGEDAINEITKNISEMFGIDIEKAQEQVIEHTNKVLHNMIFENPAPSSFHQNEARTFLTSNRSKRKTLDEFGINLNKKLKNSEQILMGREDAIDNIMRILQRKYKNNPLIIGEPGVGKTAVVEGIAKRLADENYNGPLKNVEIYSINVADLFSGTKFRGDLEERIQNIIKEAKEDKNVILYFDEIHTILHKNGNEMNIGQFFKPYLARGEVQVIGSTTFEEYRNHIEKDAALSRRFQNVFLEEPDEDATFEIINGIKHQLEAYHGINIDEDVIREAIYLSKRYMPNRFFPDKAIDLIDEASAHKKMKSNHYEEQKMLEKELERLQKEKEIYIENDDLDNLYKTIQIEKRLKEKMKQKSVSLETEDLRFILEKWIGIPSEKMTLEDLRRLKNIENKLNERVKGQKEAVSAISKTVRRTMVGLQEADRPLGSFLLLGPTGVGKTELAKALTEFLFGDEKFLIRVDMSEYIEEYSVSKLIGSPPGYIGYNDEGILTKKIRENPYSVVLLDEFDKAHPAIQKVLLQLLDEGRITNGSGMTVNAKNCYIIMTSNTGSHAYHSKKTALGFGREDDETRVKDIVMQELKSTTNPEFLNRIDEIILFNSLNEETMLEIAKKFINSLEKMMHRKGYTLKFTNDAVKFLAKEGYDPEYGARPLKRTMNNVKDLISESIIENPDKKDIHIGVKRFEKGRKLYIK